MKITHIAQYCGLAVTLAEEFDTQYLALVDKSWYISSVQVTQDYSKFRESLISIPQKKRDFTAKFPNIKHEFTRLVKTEKVSPLNFSAFLTDALANSNSSNKFVGVLEENDTLALMGILFLPCLPRYTQDKLKDSRFFLRLLFFNLTKRIAFISDVRQYTFKEITLSHTADLTNNRRNKSIQCINEPVVNLVLSILKKKRFGKFGFAHAITWI